MERMYVLKEGDDVIAYARLKPDDTREGMGGRPRWYLAHIYVIKRMRGQGYSHSLLDQIAVAADQEHVELRLGVDPPTGSPLTAYALRKLYRKYGFVSERRNINVMRRIPKRRRPR